MANAPYLGPDGTTTYYRKASGAGTNGDPFVTEDTLPTGAATEAKQDTGNTSLSSIDGKITACNTGAVVVSSGSVTASIAAAQTLANVTTVGTITNVVNDADNSGSLTVDAPVGTPVFVRLSDGSSAIATLPVSLASVPSHAVTNAGTFAVQVTSNQTQADGTAIVWDSAGTNGTITLTSLANNAARQGTKVDLGATRAKKYMASILSKMAAAATDGTELELWWAPSPSGTAGTSNPGNVSGTDASYSTPSEYKRQLQFVGSLVLSNTAGTAAQYQVVGPFTPRLRYGSIVVVNAATGQALSSTATDHVITIWPVTEAG